jgi:hypothetical protein
MTQEKRSIRRRRSLPYHDVIGQGAILWFSDSPEGHFRLPLASTSDRPAGPRGTGTRNSPAWRNTLVRYGPDRVATPRAREYRQHEEHEMKKGRHPAYGAIVTITGQGQAISGGTLIGCAMRQGSPLTYAYVFQGAAYPVTGSPETNWSVTVSGSGYSFPGSEQGKSWTRETIEVAVLPITINGIESGHSPG